MRPGCGKPIYAAIVAAVVVAATVLLPPSAAQARVRLGNICTIYGQQEVQLTGIGLVVGLNGTGDGGDNLPAMRALAATMKLMNSPVQSIEELQDADNVAIVLIEATVPRTGLRRGQKIDCHVSSLMGAESLRGGRLLVSPVETAEITDDSVAGLASGPIYIEDSEVPTSGMIPGGVVLEDDFVKPFIKENRITLLLDASHSSFHAASEAARVVNREFSFETSSRELARAIGPGVIQVEVPRAYLESPVQFVAEVLNVTVDNPHTQGRVVVNAKSGTVVVTGEVEISPVVISHENLTVEVGTTQTAATGGGNNQAAAPFVPVDQQNPGSTQQLQQLVQALNQLRVPTEDVISIIRELHRSGKLHAAYEEH